jgi:hypothetical protein
MTTPSFPASFTALPVHFADQHLVGVRVDSLPQQGYRIVDFRLVGGLVVIGQ